MRPVKGKRPPSQWPEGAIRLIVRSYLRRIDHEERTERVRVIFNWRMRTAIGRSEPSRNRIYLNPRLIDRHPEELIPTLVHELCHLVAGYKAGHGPEWQELMWRCGFPPETFHELDVSEFLAARRSWRWRCRRCGEIYVRKNRAAHRYRCGTCGGSLELLGEDRRAAREAAPPRRKRRR